MPKTLHRPTIYDESVIERIPVQVTPDQKKTIAKYARAAGYGQRGVSTFMRELALGDQVHPNAMSEDDSADGIRIELKPDKLKKLDDHARARGLDSAGEYAKSVLNRIAETDVLAVEDFLSGRLGKPATSNFDITDEEIEHLKKRRFGQQFTAQQNAEKRDAGASKTASKARRVA